MNTEETLTGNSLPSFEQAIPLNDNDQDFLDEIRSVFAKYGNLERFGLCLLHQHFAVDRDEVLLETHDKERRTLAVETVKRDAIPNLKPTMWSLTRSEALQACAEDKCKGYEVLQNCAEDKCK